MDPEDLALLAQLTGRGRPQADPTVPSDQQLMAEVLAHHIAANSVPGRPAAPPIDPEQLRLSQLYAEALGRHIQSQRAGQLSPAAAGAPPAGASDIPTGLPPLPSQPWPRPPSVRTQAAAAAEL